MAGQSLDTRLRRIEQKLGIADEQIAQEFAEHVHKRLDRLDQRLKSLECMVLGKNRYQETGGSLTKSTEESVYVER